MKRHFSLLLIVLVLLSGGLTMQGCTLPNQPFIKKDFDEKSKLRMIRYETPPHRLYSASMMGVAIGVSAILGGGVGAAAGYMIYHATTFESPNPEIPDFGKMVMSKFVERSKKEIPCWPEMDIQETTIKEAAASDGSGFTIELKIIDIRIEKGSGLAVNTIITMKDRKDEIIAEKGFTYDPSYYGRLCTYENFKTDNFKKLKEEFAFASDRTVDDFITHFKNSQEVAQK